MQPATGVAVSSPLRSAAAAQGPLPNQARLHSPCAEKALFGLVWCSVISARNKLHGSRNIELAW
jgi:hypothetical protein